ncbi:NAD(P)-binding protein [Mycena venus]|uniref:NAD(P)-binding protein n=1 Tax=Mycena venus TaxID=2733690 RepID=A0A8H6XY64_9AGAR|nr:NAD(P)-binding protein [Mycena venus]
MTHSILILGATGVSGLAFIPIALSQPNPPALTLYVRSRAKLPEGIEKQARVVDGSLTDKDALLEAMEGVDTVISFLGAYPALLPFFLRTTSTPIGDAFPGILSAMRAKGVKRIFALSTPSYSPDPSERFSLGWTMYGLLPKVAMPQGNAEMVGIAEAVAAADDLDWTIVRVPMLTEKAADLPVAAGLLGPDFKGSLYLSRASMAVWILKEMEERQWVKKAPMLSNY